MKVKLKPTEVKRYGVTQGKEYEVIGETGQHYRIVDDNENWFCYSKRFFDIVEEPQPEPKTATLEELKEYCKSEIQKEQESIYQHETIMIARKQVIKAYEDILGRIGG